MAGSVQVGVRLEALSCFLYHVQHLLPERLRSQLRELYGVTVAVPVTCMGETGLRVGGNALAACDPRRNCHQLPPWSLQRCLNGGLGHVNLAFYWTHLPNETDHGTCNAHLLRNLEEIVELEKEPDGWAAYTQRWLLEVRDVADCWFEATGGPVPMLVCAETAVVWDAFLEPVLDYYAGRPPPARGCRGHNLALWTLRDV